MTEICSPAENGCFGGGRTLWPCPPLRGSLSSPVCTPKSPGASHSGVSNPHFPILHQWPNCRPGSGLFPLFHLALTSPPPPSVSLSIDHSLLSPLPFRWICCWTAGAQLREDGCNEVLQEPLLPR